MFSKIASFAAAALLLATVAAPAHAALTNNAITTNGINQNGVEQALTVFAIDGIELPSARQ